VNAYDIHVFSDPNGKVCASVTDLVGQRSLPLVLNAGQWFAIQHITEQIKAQEEEGTINETAHSEDSNSHDQGLLFEDDARAVF